jgi:hypothetical protein
MNDPISLRNPGAFVSWGTLKQPDAKTDPTVCRDIIFIYLESSNACQGISCILCG